MKWGQTYILWTKGVKRQGCQLRSEKCKLQIWPLDASRTDNCIKMEKGQMFHKNILKYEKQVWECDKIL